MCIVHCRILGSLGFFKRNLQPSSQIPLESYGFGFLGLRECQSPGERELRLSLTSSGTQRAVSLRCHNPPKVSPVKEETSSVTAERGLCTA